MQIEKHWLCVIDAKNEQEDFACITQLIIALEHLEAGGGIEDVEQQRMLNFRIMHAPDGALPIERQIESVENILREDTDIRVRRISSWRQLYEGLQRGGNQNHFSYHIRVNLHSRETDLPTLRYLVLLIQSLPAICNKTIVLFWDECLSASEQNKIYFRTSHFLRFIQSRYHMFWGIYQDKIRALSIQSSGVQQTFIPLLEIDESTYSALTKTWNVRQEFCPNQSFSELYKALVPSCKKEDSYTITLFQIGARFLFRSLNGHRYARDEKKRGLLQVIIDVVKAAGGITPLDMLLFGALMGKEMYDEIKIDALKQYLFDIKLFSRDVAQILENICHHSEHKKGVFAMRLQTSAEYIEKNYPAYQILDKEYALELLIADANRRDGIVSHFLSGDKATAALRVNGELLSLADFFVEQPAGAVAELWRQARMERPGTCHGLLSFSKSVRDFGGAFYVRSGPTISGTDGRNYYYQVGTDRPHGEILHDISDWVPGTQFSAVFCRVAFHKAQEKREHGRRASILDEPHIIYATTYQDLALALQFQHELQPLFCHGDEPEMQAARFAESCENLRGQKRKEYLSEQWKKLFDEKANQCELSGDQTEYFLFYASLKRMNDESEAYSGEFETFCKGFLSSNFFQKGAKDNVRYIILFTDMSPNLGISFYQTLSVLNRRIDTSHTYVYFYQESKDNEIAPYYASTLQETMHRMDSTLPPKIDQFPQVFPYLLLNKTSSGESLFELGMAQQAKLSITSSNVQGYKIEDTHMRLGNKVHLDAFFEMALFFENPNYAYYTAFLILQRLKDRCGFYEKLKNKRYILFYGYSSYSRSIIWAAIQIWQEYLEQKGEKDSWEIEFAIYQNDLKLESDQPNVQMYYSRKDWQIDPQKIWDAEKTALIQIVPISSSLTTFNKMQAELRGQTKRDFQPLANLTAFWVRDDYRQKLKADEQKWKPTREEEDFWDRVHSDDRWVESKSLGINVQYLVSVSSFWRNPLTCEKCFPAEVIMEFPLVETDPTSTVPTQQLYLNSIAPELAERTQFDEADNDERVARIRGNLLYGHISRGHNHFQYYLQTRRYFQQERWHIRTWLEELSNKDKIRNQEMPHIDVLVVPKQTSNVEFSQFVYEYYFKGEAESIVVNTEKEFRSNFLAEYNGLARRLRAEQDKGCEVRLHYIDTAIDSGITFHRAAALISSLFERQGICCTSMLNIPFKNVFLLISRMSHASKQAYVREPDKHFHAYVELHISNMRSFGDSCVPCKLQQEAWRSYQNAATRPISAYWERKSILRDSIAFDDPELRKKDFEEGFCRMACAHRANHYFGLVHGQGVPDYFRALKMFFSELLDAAHGSSDVSPVYQRLSSGEDNPIYWISAGLKVMSRPFFSFDYKFRCAVMDLYLLLSEYLLYPKEERLTVELFAKEKAYLAEKDTLDWIKAFAKEIEGALYTHITYEKKSVGYRLKFIQSHLLKGLTDLKSNYILRYSTICAIFGQISEAQMTREEQNDFIQHYIRSILRLVNNSSDETKSVWLEHLLQVQFEFPKKSSVAIPERKLQDDIPMDVRPLLQHFIDILLVENNRPLFQGVRDLNRVLKNEPHTSLEKALNAHHMRNVCQFISLGNNNFCFDRSSMALRELNPLIELYRMLEDSEISDTNDMKTYPLKRYDDLREVLQKIALENIEAPDSKQVLLFGPQNPKSQLPKPADYYMISPQPPIDYEGQERADADLKHLKMRLEQHTDALAHEGFCLIESENDPSRYDVVLLLDNNYDALHDLQNNDKHPLKKIEAVYIFLPCGADRMHALMLVRKILMFRCRLIAWLEQDFNNHTIAALLQQRYWAETLAADKVGDHAEQDFVECMQRVLNEDYPDTEFVDTIVDNCGKEEVQLEKDMTGILPASLPKEKLDGLTQWYLMCAYVNSRISRLYRTHAQEASHFGCPLSLEENIKQVKKYYARDLQRTGMGPAYSLKDIFFTQIEAMSSRRNYLKQIMKVITFTVDDREDTCNGVDIETRMTFLRQSWESYLCVQFKKDGQDFAYLSEYLAVIFLDCCISALKASKEWQEHGSGYEVFLKLEKVKADEKCKVSISREQGEEMFDYLVIENDVYTFEKPLQRSGPGMSQEAMHWYIEKFWKFITGREDGSPKVIIEPILNEMKYRIKLPILKKKEDQK